MSVGCAARNANKIAAAPVESSVRERGSRERQQRGSGRGHLCLNFEA